MKLQIEIGSVMKGLEAGFNSAKNKLKSFASSIKSTLGGAFAGIGAGLSVAGLAAFTTKAVNFADDIAKGAKRMGIMPEEFQKLTFAAERSGAGMGDVEKAFKRMSKTIYDASTGMKESKDTLDALGISLTDLEGKSPDEQFKILSSALNNVTDATTKSALAQDLFGRSGTMLLPMIADYEALSAEIETMGGIISNEAVASAEKFKDALTNIGTTLQASLLDSGLVEYLGKVVEGFSAVISMKSKLGPEKGIGAPGSAGYRGGVSGFFSNMIDAAAEGDGLWAYNPIGSLAAKGLKKVGLGEQEGTQIVNMGTEADRKKLEEADKKFQESGKTTGQRKDEAKAKAEGLKNASETARKEKELQREKDKQAAIEERKTANIAGALADMNEKLKIQKMINAGKEKEAAIEQALSDARKKGGRDLSETEAKSISDSAAALFDAQHKPGKEAAIEQALSDARKKVGRDLSETEAKSISDSAAALFDAQQKPGKEAAPVQNIGRIETSDAVKRIGGVIGEGATPSAGADKVTTLLADMKMTLKSIDEKTERNYGNNSMVFP